MGYILMVFFTVVALDLFVRICVYAKTRDPKVKHEYFWWK